MEGSQPTIQRFYISGSHAGKTFLGFHLTPYATNIFSGQIERKVIGRPLVQSNESTIQFISDEIKKDTCFII